MTNKIGIIFSPGFGAGWSTWGDPNSCLDQELAKAIHENAPLEKLEEIANKNWPGQYTGGLHECEVTWVNENTQFRIAEYDGSESVHFNQDGYWLIAK